MDAVGRPVVAITPLAMRCTALVLGGVLLAQTALASEWRTYAGGPRRLFFNPNTIVTPANFRELRVKWKFPTNAVVTASPSIAELDVPGEGRIQVAYIQSWDHTLYAIRTGNGAELWHFAMDDQPGATFPNAGSVDIESVDGAERVFVTGGESIYSLDAVSGQQLWRFDAGTGCGYASPPGLCGFMGERNEVESSPIIAGNVVVFGMDVNDEGGNGGFYGVDPRDGRLVWYFDLETGATCKPLPTDDIRRFDGYHTETELGLPPGFLGTRPGCNFDRTPPGCGNVWSSAAVDDARSLPLLTTGNCDTDNDPMTAAPPPPMPPFDAAIVALHFDGTPAWRWRPRDVDPSDFDFGAVPNLFSITVNGTSHDVVGSGCKDGTYYVIDRDGVNPITGAHADPVTSPSDLPYWTRNVVPGGDVGGILATAAVDEAAG